MHAEHSAARTTCEYTIESLGASKVKQFLAVISRWDWYVEGLLDTLGDEIHNRLPVLRSQWIMSLAFLDEDRDLAAEVFVALLSDQRVVIQPGVQAAANVEDRYAGFGQRGQVIERLRFRHVAAE